MSVLRSERLSLSLTAGLAALVAVVGLALWLLPKPGRGPVGPPGGRVTVPGPKVTVLLPPRVVHVTTTIRTAPTERPTQTVRPTPSQTPKPSPSPSQRPTPDPSPKPSPTPAPRVCLLKLCL